MENSTNVDATDDTFKFILFTLGMSEKSTRAVENLKKIGDQYLDGNYELEIIDISRDKHLAVEYQIIGIPTLIKINPQPSRLLLGDLSNTEKVLRILEIK